ncbi:peptide ABC transporter substrate-binding protein [Paracoccus laeviglucosivorans]|uniref:Peptide/nickel transport system substrate-binding protein n=1 Tax=Paracoccus laeviglucosivorans TaxID=1197861 RepID=A0A521ANS8_9RHOB|nr:peptide ABC transporter substrate-binding protein [Paracoccus laeviglucosivorans]SMO36290.1 peptide/nickel transport system substrate-binding protein [Paracoccus laeviglucosivorans]
MRNVAMISALCTVLAPMAHAERGADGQLNILYWQAPSTLNPYLSSGTKDLEPSSLVIEPLAGFDEKGDVFPRLAAEIPSAENGGISADLKTVTWRLKPGLKWSDGTPVTSEDVKFTADYCMNPDGGCAQLGRYEGIDRVEAPDPLTVVIHYAAPRPNPFTAFTGAQSPILQKAQFAGCMGAAASTCTDQNFRPIGTGPFRVTEFRTNDALTLEANPNYRDPAKPAFATVTVKGGGDAAGAATAVLETGEFDYAWNTQVPPDLLKSMEAAGKGRVVTAFGTLVERVEMNLSDPSPDLPETERATIKHPHPILSDERVRRALSMALDRQLLSDVGYGPTGRATCNLVPAPEVFASDNTGCIAQDSEGAMALLDQAGWVPGTDGVREKDGRKLHLLFQTSANPIRQDYQALIKQWWQNIGVSVELKVVEPAVFFGADANSPDTFIRFNADVEMFANNFDGTDPEPYLARYTCDKAPSPDTQWQGENINRYCNAEFDKLLAELGRTSGVQARGAIAKKLNDMLTKDGMVVVPLVDRGRVSAHSNALGGVVMNAWDSELWNAADWVRAR